MRKIKTSQNKHFKTNEFIYLIFAIVVSFIYFIISYEKEDYFNWSNIRPDIKDSILSIELSNTLHSQVTGYSGTKSEQYIRQEWIVKHASIYELQKLKTFPSGAIKALSYEALIKQQQANRTQLLEEVLNDTSSFLGYMCGCEIRPLLLSEYIFEYAFSINNFTPNFEDS